MEGIIFIVLALTNVIVSIRISNCAENINKQTRIAGVFIGGIILAGVTSLPELVTSFSAVIINNPSLAVGNVLGSNLFNIVVIATVDIFYVRKKIFDKISPVFSYIHVISLVIYLSLITLLGLNYDLQIFNVSASSILMIVGYIVYINVIGKIKINPVKTIETKKRYSVDKLIKKLILLIIILITTSILITLVANTISIKYPVVSSSIIGAFLLGISTSLPEVVTVYTLVHLKSYDLALSNILGSNLFNFLILGLADVVIRNNTIIGIGTRDDLLLLTGGLFISGILMFSILKNPTFNKGKYIIPSLIIVAYYFVYWYLQFIR